MNARAPQKKNHDIPCKENNLYWLADWKWSTKRVSCHNDSMRIISFALLCNERNTGFVNIMTLCFLVQIRIISATRFKAVYEGVWYYLSRKL